MSPISQYMSGNVHFYTMFYMFICILSCKYIDECTETCGLDPPAPHLKLGENIIWMQNYFLHALFVMSGDQVLHKGMFWLALHYVLEQRKIYFIFKVC